MKFTFIRDDDVYKDSLKFRYIFFFLKKIKIPTIYGVIPQKVEKKLVEFLKKEKKKDPNLIDIVQHGWKHKNYSKDINNKYEFGPTRSYIQQKKDILKGYKKMQKLFGEYFTPAFVPPYHGYNSTTLNIIEELKIPLFSGEKINTRKNFLNLPIKISLNDYSDKKMKILDPKISIKKFLFYLNSNSEKTIGIVFHHSGILSKNDLNNFKIFCFFLKKLEKEKKIKFILFSSLLKRKFSNFSS